MKKLFSILTLMSAFTLGAQAQSGTNSPYSQYGLGVLSSQAQGFNRGMDGLALGLRRSNQVNFLNPASYSAVDSFTMIIDAGLSGQVTNFKEGGNKVNASNADFEYITACFRALPRLGVSVGIVPFTNIGYNYASMEKVGTSSSYSTETHNGSGGIHQAYLGAGYEVMKGLSVGANFSNLWGSYDKSITVSNTDSYVNTISRNYKSHVNSYKLDFGVQYQRELLPGETFTFGATYGMGHNLGNTAYMVQSSSNTETSTTLLDTVSVSDAHSIPATFGAGVSWQHGRKLLLGFDWQLQKWSGEKGPEVDATNGNYLKRSGLYADRTRLTFGGEWIPNLTSKYLIRRIRYRFGASYASPYIKVNGHDGPKEYSVSLGLGIPIQNVHNGRSLLNISGQWQRSSAQDLITENTFRVNIGITFNEAWFKKWKVR